MAVILFPPGRFGAILIDPPWPFATWSARGRDRSPDKHYQTMTFRELAALPVGSLAADDCALFMWAVWPQLDMARALIDAWGFTYKTVGFVWVKTNKDDSLFKGLGYWTRANTEPCLFATRGKPKRRARDVSQVIMSPRGRHSEKPGDILARIERLVDGPYIELFARERAPGWTSWGDQLPEE